MSRPQFTLHFAPGGEVLDAAKACEHDVFFAEYGNTQSQWDEEYGPYEQSSIFLAVTGEDGDAVAAMRLILPGPVGLKSLIDTSRPPWFVDGERAARAAGLALERTWDVATIGIRKGTAAQGQLSAALYHGVYRAVLANNARWIVMILDERARRLLNAVGVYTHPLPGTRPGPYLGSQASTPLWGDLVRMADRQRRADPDAYRLINLGVGLEEISLPVSFALPEPARLALAAHGLVGVQPAH
jgi:hypothetical protein